MQREHEKHGWGRSQGSLELYKQHYNSLNKPRSATLNTGSASIGNGLRNPYSKSRIHLDHSPWATPLYWFLELCFPPAKIPMPSFAPCFRYVFLTNPTDFHSSSNLSLTPTLFKHQTVTIYKNSDYGQEAPRLKSYLKSWKNKRPDTLATRNLSRGWWWDVPQRQVWEIMEQNIWAGGSGQKCFLKGRSSFWMDICLFGLTNRYLLSLLCARQCSIYWG